ncbi:MAG: chorismate mutase [Candidatus Paceibacterota bacterium]
MSTPNDVLLGARESINAIDKQMIQLVARRLQIVMNIVVPEKLKNGMLLYDAAREAEHLEMLRSIAIEEGLPEHVMTKIFRTVMDAFLSEEIRQTNGKTDTLFCPDCGFFININDPKFNPRITEYSTHKIQLIGSKPTLKA